MKKQPLTPFQQVILDVLHDAAAHNMTLTFEELEQLKVPMRRALSARNKMAVHMKEIRKKTGLSIENVRGVGYRLTIKA